MVGLSCNEILATGHIFVIILQVLLRLHGPLKDLSA